MANEIEDDGYDLIGNFIKFENKDYIVPYDFRFHCDEYTYEIVEELDNYYIVKSILDNRRRLIYKKYVRICSPIKEVMCPRCGTAMEWSVRNSRDLNILNSYTCFDCRLCHMDYLLLHDGNYDGGYIYQHGDLFLIERRTYISVFLVYRKYDGYALLEKAFRHENDAREYIWKSKYPACRWMRIEI